MPLTSAFFVETKPETELMLQLTFQTLVADTNTNVIIYRQRYHESVSLVAAGWGWDVTASRPIYPPVDGQVRF